MMLQEIFAEKLLDNETLQEYVPAARDASDAMHALSGEKTDKEGRIISPGAAQLAAVAALGYAGVDVTETYLRARRELVDLLMHDKELLKNFEGGKFEEFFKARKDDFFHFQRQSPFGKHVSDAKKGFELRNELAGHLEQHGISRIDALRQLRLGYWQSLALRAGVPLAGAAFAFRKAEEMRREQGQGQSPQI